MTDKHRHEFHGRLKRIDDIHARGGGFEADGTLGQSYYTNKRQDRGIPIRPFLYVLIAVIGFKAVLLASMGSADYLARVEALEAGGMLERAGAFMMRIDPLTGTVSELLAPLFENFSG